MSKKIKIGLVQCNIIADVDEMNSHVEKLIKDAAIEEPDILVLPERWRPIPEDLDFKKAINEERGQDYQFIKSVAKKYGVSIISGGIWEYREINGQKKAFITAYYFDKRGNEIGRQDKLHLYSYEPNVFTPGDTLNIFKDPATNTKFSILICFDIAFYETPRMSVEEGAELLISPTLIRSDGLDNWAIYLKARALENRVPVVACNPVGSFFGRHFSGNSKFISFKTGHESPSILKVRELPIDKSLVEVKTINVSYPTRIRKKRLSEKIKIKNINRKFLNE